MGSYFSRNSGEVQDIDISADDAYRFPPKTGNFFASHYIMGGEKFETMQPEAYLFGENSDINFLGPKPYNAPYYVSSPSQPVKAIRCFVNIRKDSLRLVKVPRSMNKNVKRHERNTDPDRQITAEEGDGPFLYNIEFTFDADTPCSVTIYYNATEEMVNKNVIYSSEPARDCSDTVHFSPGCNQQFCLPSHRIDPLKLATTTVDWTKGYTKIPIVIQICADCGPSIVGHSHITYAEFYKLTDSTWSIKTVKQKQAIDGVCYLIQEIFGIENKSVAKNEEGQDDGGNDDDDSEDDSSDCVVCLSETRDTLILPCKHLCLCSTCANQLRYQQNGCPICRQSFRALLQIRAVRKKTTDAPMPTGRSRRRQTDDGDSENEEDEVEVVVPVPPGYEVIPLIEAIKGRVGLNSTAGRIETNSTAPSTSLDEVTVIDETTQSSTAGSISCHVTADEPTNDAGSEESEEHPVTSIVYNDSEVPSVSNEQQSMSDDESRLYEIVSRRLHSEMKLPAGTAESETTETQEMANELLPEAEEEVEEDESSKEA